MSMPVWTTVLSSEYSITEIGVGWIAGFEMLGFAIGSFGFSQKGHVSNARNLCFLGMGIFVLANLSMLFVESFLSVIVIRSICGLCEGVIVAFAARGAIETKAPEKTYGMMNASIGLIGGAFLVSTPFTNGLFGPRSVFISFAIVGLLTATLVRNIPVICKSDSPRSNLGAFNRVFLSLLFGGITLATLVDLGLWAFVDFKALDLELDIAFRTTIFATTAVLSVLGSGVSIIVGARFGYLIPMILSTVAMAVCAVTVGISSTGLQLALGIAFLIFSFQVLIPFVMGYCAYVDPDGKLVGIVTALLGIGQALGPPVAGYVLSFGFVALGIVFGILCFVSSFMFWAALNRSEPHRNVRSDSYQ